MAAGKKAAINTVGSPAKRAREVVEPNSPLKRLKIAREKRELNLAVRQEIVLSSVDEFRAYVIDNEKGRPVSPDINVVVRGMMLWATEHPYAGGKYVRLHVTDACPTEPLEELMEFKDDYEDSDEARIEANALLLTVTIFGETLESKIPLAGAVIRMPKTKKRLVYDDKFCQLLTRLENVIIE